MLSAGFVLARQLHAVADHCNEPIAYIHRRMSWPDSISLQPDGMIVCDRLIARRIGQCLDSFAGEKPLLMSGIGKPRPADHVPPCGIDLVRAGMKRLF